MSETSGAGIRERASSEQPSIAQLITDLVATDDIQLPPLPEVATRIQELLTSEQTSTRKIGSLLAQDPAIAAALLRLANSAAFGGLGRIETLTDAIQRIGMKQVGAIVTGLCLKGHFEHPSPVKRELLRTLWDHAVASGFAARAIAGRVGVPEERAFLAGLLHDCGKVLVLVAADHLEERSLDFAPSRGLLLELMQELHGDLGYRVLVSWNFPEELASVAQRHEGPAREADDLVLCVQAANLITRKLGFHLDPDEELRLVGEPVMLELGLDDLTLATLMVDMEDHLAEMKRLF